VTFIIEGESPRKSGNEEDESFGVFGGEITEEEKMQREATSKKSEFLFFLSSSKSETCPVDSDF